MKRIFLFALILLMVFPLAACSAKKAPEAAASDPSEKAGPSASAPAPTDTPAPTPDPDAFVPEGYDAHDYLALVRFFSAPLEGGAETIGECCYDGFDAEDPSTWCTSYDGVKWDDSGKCTEIRMHASSDKLPAELDLTGFEKLSKLEIWFTTIEKLTIADCPALTDGCMIYSGTAEGEARIEAGYVTQLNAASRTKVYCSLMGDAHPFVLDLTSDGPGSVKASAVYYDGEYNVCGVAMEDEYVEFLGWFDGSGRLVSSEKFFYFSGGELGQIEGEHRYTARFAKPDAPAPISGGDFFCELKPNVPSMIDIDGDGNADTVLVSVDPDDPEDYISVTVTLASKPGAPYHFHISSEGGAVCAAAADFDPSDKHTEIMLCYDMCDGDPATVVLRLKDDGSGFDVFTEYIEAVVEYDDWVGSWYYNGLPESFVFNAENGFCFVRRTEILGTTFVANRFTVTKDGFVILNDEYLYLDTDPLVLKKALKLTLEDGSTITVPVGAKITAYSTDCGTFVKVRLEDGRIGRAEVSFSSDGWPIYINGVQQDKYAEIPYAD